MILMITTKEREKIGLLNFKSLGVLTSCAAIFFVVILSQINMREKIVSDSIIYLECFYFIMYFAIIMVAVNTVLFCTSENIRFIQYHDNLIPKLLYWPVVLGLLLGVTLSAFY